MPHVTVCAADVHVRQRIGDDHAGTVATPGANGEFAIGWRSGCDITVTAAHAEQRDPDGSQ